MSQASQAHWVVVPHTHWDREWYRTHEQFRYRLVQLLDGLLDLLERDPAFRHFTLDGQTIVLDDYFEVRPDARDRVERLVRAGRLVVGPWYVLPDEWLVSGEALIRNLRRGLARAEELGGAMSVGYVPDQFGHVGQLPQIFAGFGFEAAALWRGVGDDVNETLFRWSAPDGTTLLTAYLAHGYGNAALLPLDSDSLTERLRGECDRLKSHSRIPTLLLMNGADHLSPQPGLPLALGPAAQAVGASFEIGTLAGYLARARDEVSGELPAHRGELRSGLRAPLLSGCASARMPQKRRDFENDRLLTRYLEPLAAWLGALGGDPDPGILDLAWGIALQNHPHDSICGCSVDAVHEQMETRFARVAEIGAAHLRRVTSALARRIDVPGGEGAGVAVWNPHAGGYFQAEGEVELDVPARSPLHARDSAGRRIPVHAEPIRPGRDYADFTMTAEGVGHLVRGFPPEFFGEWVREVRLGREGETLTATVVMGDDPPAGFDLTAVKERVLGALGREPAAPARFRVRRPPALRVRLADDLPGCGLRVYRIARGRADGPSGLVSERQADGGVRIANEHWQVEVSADGVVACEHRKSGAAIADAVRLVSEADRGDEYTFDPVPGAPSVSRPARARVRLAPASEAEAAIAIDARYRVPSALASDRSGRLAREVWLPARIELRLAAGLDRLDVAVAVDNRANDHRVRIHFALPFEPQRLEVESAFEVVERPIAPAPSFFGSDRPAELPSGATPQRSFATAIGTALAATVANRGSAEVEVVRDSDGSGSLAVTLLRAVGWLSRDDLVMRPGHAGPPFETPGAQVPGPHRADLSLRLHAPGDEQRTAAAHHFAAPPLLFACEEGAGELADTARLFEVDDPLVVVSAIESAADGSCEVRLYNESPDPRRVRVRWNGPGVLESVDLSGRSAGEPALEPESDGARALPLRGHQIATLRVEPGKPAP